MLENMEKQKNQEEDKCYEGNRNRKKNRMIWGVVAQKEIRKDTEDQGRRSAGDIYRQRR